MDSIQSSFNHNAIESENCTHSNDHETVVRLSKENVLLFRELKNVKTQFGQEISLLKGQIAEMQSKLGGVSTNTDCQELETIRFKNSLLETKNQTLVEDIVRLDDELLEANDRFGLLPSLNSLLENQVDELKQEVQQLNSLLEVSKNKSLEHAQKNDELVKQNQALNERLKSAENELLENAQKNVKLVGQNRILNERLKIAESKPVERAQKSVESSQSQSKCLKSTEAQQKIEVSKQPEKVFVSNKQTSKALEKQADAKCDLEKYEDAIQLYSKAIYVAKGEAKKPSYIALLWSDISDCYHNLGRYDEDVKANEKAIRCDSSVPLYYLNRAQTYMKMNMKQETIERWINKALELDPNDKEAKDMLAKLAKK